MLPKDEYTNDILIVAGDISCRPVLIQHVFEILKTVFMEVMYVPGNHDLWVRKGDVKDSLKKFLKLIEIAEENSVLTKPAHFGGLSIIPLHGWYDNSFGPSSPELDDLWMDKSECKWPEGYNDKKITDFFISLNKDYLNIKNTNIISFSHFLPRIDIMPKIIPKRWRGLYPVLGSLKLDSQIRELGSDIHVFGHSHVNLKAKKDGTVYLNNAFGYPYEKLITRKRLLCIHEL